MAILPQSILDEIRDRVSIVQYIGEHLPLKKAGRNHKGNCPFHQEKTASFMVSDEKQIYHCFGCGEGGNVFSFAMKYESLSFMEAVKQLAERAGVELPKENMKRDRSVPEEDTAYKKKLLLRVNQISAEYFFENLKNAQVGDKARNYLKSRGYLDEFFTQHFLGYADNRWDGLVAHLMEKKVPLDLAVELGLIKKKEGRNEYYDFFRDRVIFPIVSPRKEILGFGGRIIEKDDDSAKYLNSPDSAIYHKSYVLYGLNVAQREIRERDQVVIVEGYMDALAVCKSGLLNVVAPLGTALTSAHVRLLRRYTENMVLVFDGDKAGVAAAERSLQTFVESGVSPKMIVLPEGQDPDDYLKEHTKADFEKMIGRAPTLLAWYLRKRSIEAGSDQAKKIALINELRPLFVNIKNAIEFAHYRKVLSDEMKMDEADLLKFFEHRPDAKMAAKDPAQGKASGGRMVSERLLLSVILERPELFEMAKRFVDASHFGDPSYRTIFELIDRESMNGAVTAGALLDRVADDEVVAALHSLTLDDEMNELEAQEMLQDCVKFMMRSRLTDRLKDISREIREAEDSRDEEKVTRLMVEKKTLLGGTYGATEEKRN